MTDCSQVTQDSTDSHDNDELPCGQLDPDLLRATEIIQRRWTIHILALLSQGPARFSQIRQRIPGLSSNILTTRLADLSAAGLVARCTLGVPALVQVYELTDSGRHSSLAVAALRKWGEVLLDKQLDQGRSEKSE